MADVCDELQSRKARAALDTFGEGEILRGKPGTAQGLRLRDSRSPMPFSSSGMVEWELERRESSDSFVGLLSTVLYGEYLVMIIVQYNCTFSPYCFVGTSTCSFAQTLVGYLVTRRLFRHLDHVANNQFLSLSVSGSADQ